MKKMLALILVIALVLSCASCGHSDETAEKKIEPQVSQMKAICELAVLDCYYHNVAKFTEEDAAGFLWWKKDKRFWIEYSGIVRLGIDLSGVNIEIKGDQIDITLPEATVQSCKVDSATLTADSFIVDKDSADIEAADEVAAFEAAQNKLQEAVEHDESLLMEARQRAQTLLEDYITNIGNAVGKTYAIHWIEGAQAGTSDLKTSDSLEDSPDSTQDNTESQTE